jgi:hypothetical protein
MMKYLTQSKDVDRLRTHWRRRKMLDVNFSEANCKDERSEEGQKDNERKSETGEKLIIFLFLRD